MYSCQYRKFWTPYNGYKLLAKQWHNSRMSPCWDVRLWKLPQIVVVRLSSLMFIAYLLPLNNNDVNYDHLHFLWIWLIHSRHMKQTLTTIIIILSNKCRRLTQKIFENMGSWEEYDRKMGILTDWHFLVFVESNVMWNSPNVLSET